MGSGGQYTMSRGGRYTMGRVGHYTMGREVSIYHGYTGQNTMGRSIYHGQGIRYTMAKGSIYHGYGVRYTKGRGVDLPSVGA